MRKLSEYRGEEALELLADLIEPAGEIMTDKEVASAFKENKFKGIKLAIKDHKNAVIEILATLDGKDPSTYDVDFFTLPMKVLDVLNDKDLLQLFQYQGQTGDANSSGSASVNIEE